MDYRFFTADVFTKQKFAGNQLAVFPAADGLAGETMQLIAKEFNLSETVFVLPPVRAGGTKRLRIFTPGAEVPFAGHPTVGTAAVLAVTGDLGGAGELNVIFEEGIGDVPVRIERRQGGIFAMLSAAQMPEVRATDLTPRELASLVSLKEEDLAVNGYQPLAASCGLPFTFIPVASLEALKQASLDKPGWQKSLAPGWAPQVYLFVPLEEGSKFRARMFAPALGIEEDPATGAAATAFAGYIDQIHKYSDGTVRVVIEQGVEIKRPSTIYVEFVKTKGEISAIRVGGYTVPVSQGLITI